MQIKWWMDSGANIHSCRKGVVSTEELGLEEGEWETLSAEEQEELIQEIAWEQVDWGWKEVPE